MELQAGHINHIETNLNALSLIKHLEYSMSYNRLYLEAYIANSCIHAHAS